MGKIIPFLFYFCCIEYTYILYKMSIFSERYGYVKPSDVIVRERMTSEIQNVICSCFDRLQEAVGFRDYMFLQKHLWMEFLNQRESTFQGTSDVIGDFLQDVERPWYRKLDMIEISVNFLIMNRIAYVKDFVNDLNREFARLHFAYRIVDGEVVEITSQNEICFIEDAMKSSSDKIRIHLEKAIQLYGKRPHGDYIGSIQESISAVEILCKQNLGGKGFGKILYDLKRKGMIPDSLYHTFADLYAYTIDESIGNHNAWKEKLSDNAPSSAEALFVLISCSAFINYWEMKVNQ